MTENDEDWHDARNEADDDAKRAYFREKDAREIATRLRVAGKKVHVCPECQAVLECDGGAA